MSNFKLILNEKEVEVKNNIPNSTLAAKHQIELAKKTVAMPKSDDDQAAWKKYEIALNMRQFEIIGEGIKYLAKLTGLSESELQNASQKEINEAIYHSNCELLDMHYKTREQRDKEAGLLDEEDSVKN